MCKVQVDSQRFAGLGDLHDYVGAFGIDEVDAFHAQDHAVFCSRHHLYGLKKRPSSTSCAASAGREHGEAPLAAVLALVLTAVLTILFFFYSAPVYELESQLLTVPP